MKTPEEIARLAADRPRPDWVGDSADFDHWLTALIRQTVELDRAELAGLSDDAIAVEAVAHLDIGDEDDEHEPTLQEVVDSFKSGWSDVGTLRSILVEAARLGARKARS